MKIPGLINLVKIQNAEDISDITELSSVDRPNPSIGPLFNKFISKRLHRTLSTGDKALPSILRRGFSGRAEKQEELELRLSGLEVDEAFLQLFSRFILGRLSEDSMHLGAQEVIGRLFNPEFVATKESWEAACVMDEAPRNFNPLKSLIWIVKGEVEKSQTVLSDAMGGDEYGVHGIGIAVHSLVKGLTAMRELVISQEGLSHMSSKEATILSLIPPETLLRQAQNESIFQGKTYARGTFFQLQNAEASKAFTKPSVKINLAMMSNSWSRCPAHGWIAKLLTQVWSISREARNLSDVTLVPVSDTGLTLSGSRMKSATARKIFKRVAWLNLGGVSLVGATGLFFPSKLTQLLEEGLTYSHQSTRLWGITLLIFSFLLLPIFAQPLEKRWTNAVAIIALSLFIPVYLFFGGYFTILALIQAVLIIAMVTLYFRYFKTELMTRP